VDEFLSEKEQLEQIREWWRESGWFLLGGVAVGALLLFGWNRYGAYQEQRDLAASALYRELTLAVLDRAEVQATELLAELRADYASSPYADQGGLLVASLLLDTQDTERAAEELRRVLTETDDDELAVIVRLRLARLYLHLERYAEALAVLDAAEPGRFSGRYDDLRGDIYVAQGDADRARSAYQQAFNAEHTDVLDRNLLQMKLDDLSQPVPEMPPADAVPSEDGA
jgi:predicted negative regulator of RcsB-dependent stress response